MQLVREVFARLVSADRESILELTHPEAELHTRLSTVTGKPYRGTEGVRQWLRDTDEQFSRFAPELGSVEELENGRVFASGRIDMCGRGSELQWTEDFYWVIAVEDGVLRKLETFLERDEALRAAGADD